MKNQQEIATPTTVRAVDESRNEKTRIKATKKLTYLATLTAISLVLKVISNNISSLVPPTMKISLSYLGWYLSAAVMGPLGGGIVAVITDILGQFMTVNFAPPNPVLVAGNFGATFVFGVIFKYLPVKNVTVRTVIGVTLSLLVGTLGLNSLGLYYLYYAGTNYIVYMVTQRLVQIPMAYLNAVLFILTVPVCKRLKLLTPSARPAT